MRIDGINYTNIPRLRSEDETGIEAPYVRWRGPYQSGQESFPGDMVTENNWLMVCTKRSFDSPAPQSTGPIETLLPASPGFSTQSQTAIIESGISLSMSKSGYFRELEVWVPDVGANITHSLALSVTQLGGTNVRNIPLSGLSAASWNTIQIDDIIVLEGANFLGLLETEDSSSSSTVTAPYLYEGTDQRAGPASGNYNTNNQDTILRINKFDADGTERLNLNTIGPNTDIDFVDTFNANNNQRYQVSGLFTEFADYFEYPVTLVFRNGVINVGTRFDLTATIPIPNAANYSENAGYWPANQPSFGQATGILRFDGFAQPNVFDNAYGINLHFEPASFSPDFQFAAFTNL